MTKEEKELLLKDLLGRVLYGVKVDYRTNIFTLGYNLYLNNSDVAFENYPMLYYLEKIESVKPYLRPLSSMTKEEEIEWFEDVAPTLNVDKQIDFYNKYHFDYRGLIPKGLALEAKEGMYTTK